MFFANDDSLCVGECRVQMPLQHAPHVLVVVVVVVVVVVAVVVVVVVAVADDTAAAAEVEVCAAGVVAVDAVVVSAFACSGKLPAASMIAAAMTV